MPNEYNKYSNKFKHNSEIETDSVSYSEESIKVEVGDPVIPDPEIKTVNVTIEEKKPEPVKMDTNNYVVNCKLLNIRFAPSKMSDVKEVVGTGTKLISINDANSNIDPAWIKVKTNSGVIGYCMKEFITKV